MRAVAWWSDAQRLASASIDGTVHLSRFLGGGTHVLAGHDGAALGVDVSGDGLRVLLCGQDGRCGSGCLQSTR